MHVFRIIPINMEIPAVLPLDRAVLSAVPGPVIGIEFGVRPAWKAASIDALRYE